VVSPLLYFYLFVAFRTCLLFWFLRFLLASSVSVSNQHVWVECWVFLDFEILLVFIFSEVSRRNDWRLDFCHFFSHFLLFNLQLGHFLSLFVQVNCLHNNILVPFVAVFCLFLLHLSASNFCLIFLVLLPLKPLFGHFYYFRFIFLHLFVLCYCFSWWSQYLTVLFNESRKDIEVLVCWFQKVKLRIFLICFFVG